MRSRSFLPLLALLAAPAVAQDLQLVQPGDRDKSCAALSAEINALASNAAPAPRRKGLGGLGKMLGAAMPVLGGAVPMLGGGGAALLQAASVAGTMGSQARDPAADARRDADAAMLREERKQRLLGFFEAKGC